MNPAFLREAIELAQAGLAANAGGPFGAIVVLGDAVIGRGYNLVTSTNDPTAHAEVVAIRDACRRLGTFFLADCELYASCEPCPMCLAACYWARLAMIHYAANSEDAAAAGFDDRNFHRELMKPPEMRSIPMDSALRNEAQAVFQLWLQKGDRTPY